MKYRRIILILLFLVLGFFTISCAGKSIRQSLPPNVVTFSKYDFIVIENTRLRSNEEFKAFVEKQVENTGYIDISYDTVVRLHKTYLIRAWVFYKKVKK